MRDVATAAASMPGCSSTYKARGRRLLVKRAVLVSSSTALFLLGALPMKIKALCVFIAALALALLTGCTRIVVPADFKGLLQVAK